MQRIRIHANGWIFDALSDGPEDGQLVLLLHGFPQTGWAWRGQLRALAEAGYRAVAPDQRGYSSGARPVAVQAHRLEHLAADAVAIADAVLPVPGGTFHCAGNDWGGAVAWQLGSHHSHRLATLSVISTPHPRAYALALRSWEQRLRSAYIAGLRLPWAEVALTWQRGLLLRLLFRGTGMPLERAAGHLAALATPEDLRGPLNWYRAADRSQLAGVGRVPVPTLYCFPSREPAFARMAAEITAAYVDGPYRYEVLPGATHWVAELEPGRFNALLLEHLARTG